MGYCEDSVGTKMPSTIISPWQMLSSSSIEEPLSFVVVVGITHTQSIHLKLIFLQGVGALCPWNSQTPNALEHAHTHPAHTLHTPHTHPWEAFQMPRLVTKERCLGGFPGAQLQASSVG